MLTSRPPGTISDSQKYLSGRISRVEIRPDRLIGNQMFRKKYLKSKSFLSCVRQVAVSLSSRIEPEARPWSVSQASEDPRRCRATTCLHRVIVHHAGCDAAGADSGRQKVMPRHGQTRGARPFRFFRGPAPPAFKFPKQCSYYSRRGVTSKIFYFLWREVTFYWRPESNPRPLECHSKINRD
jgi:hypothetical protein